MFWPAVRKARRHIRVLSAADHRGEGDDHRRQGDHRPQQDWQEPSGARTVGDLITAVGQRWQRRRSGGWASSVSCDYKLGSHWHLASQAAGRARSWLSRRLPISVGRTSA